MFAVFGLVGLGIGVGLGLWIGATERAAEPVTAVAEATPPPLPAHPSPVIPPEAEPSTVIEPEPAAVALPEPEPEPVALPRTGGPEADQPAWRRHAVALSEPLDDRPLIAIVIDDLGVDRRRTNRVLSLPPPLTAAFLPYADDLERQTGTARVLGHELLVHVPMQPLGAHYDPGPVVLEVDEPGEELRRRLTGVLSRFDGYVGINNHMGSRFTADAAGMEVVMREVKARGLLFLDSRTTEHSVADDMAASHGVPFAGRDVFLDNDADIALIQAQLRKVEGIARKHGAAVAIGHPRDTTIEALAEWLPSLARRGFRLVPLSAVVLRRHPTG